MRTRRGHIQPRTRYFIGCEGESEQSYVQALQRICDTENLHVHLAGELLGGGDPLARLEAAARRLTVLERRGAFEAKFALLDTDQRILIPERAWRADRLADRLGITVIWQEPCHEGLLAKHFQGGTRRPQTAEEALSYLQEFWPSYTKAQTALQIGPHVDLEGARLAGSRIARFYDLLRTIGLA